MKRKVMLLLACTLLVASCTKEKPKNPVEIGEQKSDQTSNSDLNNKPEPQTIVEESKADKAKQLSAETKRKIDKWLGEIFSLKRLSSDKFKSYDLGHFWETSFNLGYIGTDYQRMYITFDKIRKVSSNEYNVKGFSQVKKNVCHFSGTISNLKFYQDSNTESWEEYGYDSNNTFGFLSADFIFEEDEKEKSSGVFKGALWTHWVLTYGGEIELCVAGHGDSECNNQFFGEWTSYTTQATKPVAWGENRIPMSGDLDNGAAEFIPDEKYINNGWDDFKHWHEN